MRDHRLGSLRRHLIVELTAEMNKKYILKDTVLKYCNHKIAVDR